MTFVTRIIMDPYTGKQKELTILKNWIPYTNDIHTKIPKDYIASFITPDSEVIKLYDLEKEKEDVNYKKKNIIDMANPQNNPYPPNQNIDDVEKLKSMFDFMKDLKGEDSLIDEINDMIESEKNIVPENNNFKNYISLSIMLPPEALISLVDADILDADDVQDLIDSLNENNNDSNKNKDNKNYGNRWKDWPADLDDYLDDI